MKKYSFKILLLFSSLCISLTSCNIKNLLKRPKDWNEEFWFLDKIEGNIDLNKYFFILILFVLDVVQTII